MGLGGPIGSVHPNPLTTSRLRRQAAANEGVGCWLVRPDGYACGNPVDPESVGICAACRDEINGGEVPELVACQRPHCYWTGRPDQARRHRIAYHGEL